MLKDFDIFAKVGKAAALDEVVPFTVQGSHLTVGGETSDFDGNLRVEFLKVRECVQVKECAGERWVQVRLVHVRGVHERKLCLQVKVCVQVRWGASQ